MTLLCGVVQHFCCNFEKARVYFEKLRVSAKEDGDTYLEFGSLLWKAHTQLKVGGRGTTLIVNRCLSAFPCSS